MGNTVQKSRQPCETIELEEKEEEEDDSSFTCEICIEPVSSNKRFKNGMKCGHHSYCLDCIEKHIEAKIEEYSLSEIKCPGLECGEFLDPVVCSSFLSANVFIKWCDVLCESGLSEYERVYCPFGDCSSLILNECGGNIKKTKCPNCKKYLCFQCKIPWHPGYRCGETGELRHTNDILMLQVMETNKWTRCPACNHGVELRSGCSIVRCRCGTLFCHGCGRKRSNHWCSCKSYNQFFLHFLATTFILFGVILVLFQYLSYQFRHQN